MNRTVVCLAVALSAFYIFAAANARGQQDRAHSMYNREGDESISGGVFEYPDLPAGEGTIRESITPDPAVTQGAAEDAPIADETVIEPGLQSSPLQDDTGRSTGMREDAGLDTTLREAATDDSGVQEDASPYAPAPDLFGPKKKQ